MPQNLAKKLLKSHLIGKTQLPKPGEEIALKVDQTLMQDATGTMVMLELEAMGVKKVKTEISCQYVDHNLLQNDYKNADDHLFLQSCAAKFGIYFSGPGNGVSHAVHMERFGKPGKLLIGSDSHTCAAGSMGMLAMGAGGMEVALAMTGQPFFIKMPKILGIKLIGKLNDWVSAKDVILEVLRRHSVKGGVGKIIEYYGEGLKNLTAMDRHVIANMGAELGATASVFPSDEQLHFFLKQYGRENDFTELKADPDATYDETDEIDLSKLEPLIACPCSPDNVVPVREVAGREIYQAMIGSSANPGMRDFAVPALIINGRRAHPQVSLDINPASRQGLENLTDKGYILMLIQAGARLHQAGCNGCIGMGQAPATDKISLRTVPRNFPGRSGTKEDKVYLCSPEVAIASAITGVITDPRDLETKYGIKYPKYIEPSNLILNDQMLIPPPEDGSNIEIVRGPNIQPIPKFKPLQTKLSGPILIKLGDNISTDDISPAGSNVLPFRSNIPAISMYTFSKIDDKFYERAMTHRETGSFILAGGNYGQGSSREHAALAPSYLGIKAVLAKSYARIHRSNLINFGILPLVFKDEQDYRKIDINDELQIDDIHEHVKNRNEFIVKNVTKNQLITMNCNLSEHEKKILIEGGLINYMISHHLQQNGNGISL
jgi:aconitate hydratase